VSAAAPRIAHGAGWLEPIGQPAAAIAQRCELLVGERVLAGERALRVVEQARDGHRIARDVELAAAITYRSGTFVKVARR
jgi:hypothetical protein